MVQVLRKSIALLLAAAVIMSFSLYLTAGNAYAGGGDVTVSNGDELKAALESDTNQLVKMDSDIDCNSDINIHSSSQTLDLQGNTLRMHGIIKLTDDYSGLTVTDSGYGGKIWSGDMYLFEVGAKQKVRRNILNIEKGTFYGRGNDNGAIIYIHEHMPEDIYDSVNISGGRFIADEYESVIVAEGTKETSEYHSTIKISHAIFEADNAPCIKSGDYNSVLISSGSFWSGGYDYALELSDVTENGYYSYLELMTQEAYVDGEAYNAFENGIRPLGKSSMGKHHLFQCGRDSMFDTITATADEGGSIQVYNGERGYVGANVYAKAVPDAGFKFDWWNVSSDEDPFLVYRMPDGPLTLNATFSRDFDINNCIYAGTESWIEGEEFTDFEIKSQDGLPLTRDLEYTVSEPKMIGPDKVSFTFTGVSPWFGTQKVILNVVKPAVIDLSSEAEVTLGYTSATYTGKALKPSVKVKAGEKTLKEGTDYTVTYSNNVKAGKAAVVVEGIGNYTGSVTKNFDIKKKSIVSMSASLSKLAYAYTAKACKPAVTISGLKAGTDYTVSYANNTKVGKATVTITGKGNYTGTIKKNFTINPKKAAIKSMTAGTKKLTVKMSTKVSSTGGSNYEIKYRVKGSSSWKTVTTTSQSSTLKSLKKGKTYQVKVRAYKSVNGKKYYGAYSDVKTSKKIK